MIQPISFTGHLFVDREPLPDEITIIKEIQINLPVGIEVDPNVPITFKVTPINSEPNACHVAVALLKPQPDMHLNNVLNKLIDEHKTIEIIELKKKLYEIYCSLKDTVDCSTLTYPSDTLCNALITRLKGDSKGILSVLSPYEDPCEYDPKSERDLFDFLYTLGMDTPARKDQYQMKRKDLLFEALKRLKDLKDPLYDPYPPLTYEGKTPLDPSTTCSGQHFSSV